MRIITAGAMGFCVLITGSARAATPPAPPTAPAVGIVEKTVTGGPNRKPPGYRSRAFSGGQGATWREGRDAHGFQGNYGGCKYSGVAGPGGYKINRVCR